MISCGIAILVIGVLVDLLFRFFDSGDTEVHIWWAAPVAVAFPPLGFFMALWGLLEYIWRFG